MAHRLRWPYLLTLVVLSAGCKRYIRVDDPGKLEYHPPEADAVRRWQTDLRADLAAGPLGLRIAGPEGGPDWTVVTRFVHVSDVQVRDFGIRYFTRKSEELAATVATATFRNAEVDTSDEYPLLALVGGVNARPAQDRPDFVVHTGDAVDSNSLGELLKFVAAANELKVPWFEVLGNHDIFLMGNFTEDQVIVDGAPTSGLPFVLNRSRFMELHGANRLVPASHEPTETTSIRVPASRYHGFDCLHPGCLPCSNPGTALRPYYSVRLATDPPLRLVMLDTTVPHEKVPRLAGGELPAVGASGYVEAEQFRWLQRELATAQDSGEAVLVFGHHPLTIPRPTFMDGNLQSTNPEGKDNASVLDLLKAQRHVVAYFGGHTHVARIERHTDLYRGGYPFYEVIAPSLHEYPQSAFWVEVLRRGPELAVRARPLQGTADANPVIAARLKQACAGARAHVKLAPEGTCGSDTGILEVALAGRVPAARVPTARVALRAGQAVDCGALAVNARAECDAAGKGDRTLDDPVDFSADRQAEWTGKAACGAGEASVSYAATCQQDGNARVRLALSAALAARAEAPAAGAARARGEVAPQWTVPVVLGRAGGRLRIAAPAAAGLACRARVDALPEVPLAEQADWNVTAGRHALVISCGAADATCGGEPGCARDRKVEARLQVSVD